MSFILYPPSSIIDLRLEDGSGLDVVKELSKVKKDSRIVMLTGYGNLPTAVAAVKSGAMDYMAKPVDADAVEAFRLICENEGIIPALESSHAVAYVINTLAPSLRPDQNVLVCLSGRGDKDLDTIMGID